MREAQGAGVELPALESILGKTVQLFLSRETSDPTLPSHPKHGKILQGYTFTIASHDAVQTLAESGVNMSALAGDLMQTASTRPDSDSLEGDTWQEISEIIVEEIIRLEMPLRFPDLVAENERRMHIYIEN